MLWFVGILGKSFHDREVVAGVVSPASALNEQAPEIFVLLRNSHSRVQAAGTGAWRRPGRKFQDLRAMSMTINRRTRVANPHQDHRILSSLAWFSAPHRTITSKTKICWEKREIRRSSHGIARALEDLRGVRLSLVPGPGPGECLLPGV